MEHLAIMKKSWKLIPKILSGEKKIESRWYMAKFAPWNRIRSGETIYFKNGGESVSAKATVGKVLQFEDLNKTKIKQLLNEYAKDLGIKDLLGNLKFLQNKRYCILIYLENAQEIEPFDIDKKGFGNACAWICTNSIKRLRK
jgi:ASC-1-like (ASCH) protein